ncbi:hypothetical protein LJR129_005031 [Acidovorax sp. LjRoot129]|uniref:hypothetical protein n=1 Tax=unclassified Acidovorax TaxID=2684926 RepID=UPI003ECF7649
MAKLITIPISDAPLAALDWASAVSQGMPLREPVNMSDSKMRERVLPLTLWDTVNESDEDNQRVNVYPIKVVRYGVDGTTGAALPSITYIDHTGKRLRNRVTEFFETELEANVAKSQMLFGLLSDWSPTTRWESAGVLIDAIRPSFDCLADGTVLAKAKDNKGAVYVGAGADYKIAVTRCYLHGRFGHKMPVLDTIIAELDLEL